jgi:hypothetical protein
MRPNDAVSHEAAHGAAALLIGIAVDGYAFDRMAWDGWIGQTLLNGAALRALEGSYRDRLAIATLAYMPYVVLLGEPEGKSDIGLVEAMRPSRYSREIWRWVVMQNARRLFLSADFEPAFASSSAKIEQQMAASA